VPIYVYEVVMEDGSEGETIEVLQQMSDPPLTSLRRARTSDTRINPPQWTVPTELSRHSVAR